jgi:hydrogenase maturation protease
VRLVELDGEAARMMQAWEGSRVVWLLDAVRSGRAPGTFTEFDLTRLTDLDDSGRRLAGSHLMGLGEAVALARALDRLPPELHVLGIEGECFEHGARLSEAVERGTDAAAEFVARDVTRHL